MKNPNAYRIYLAMSGIYSMATMGIYTIVAIYYVQTVALNPLQLVLVGTALEISAFLFEVPTGVLADTYSRRLSVIIGYAMIGFCFVIEGLVPLFSAIIVAEVIRGIGHTFVSGALEAWIADEIGEEYVGQAFLRGSQVGQAGRFVGIIFGTALATIQLYIPVLLGGAILMALSVVLLFVMPETGFQPITRTKHNSGQALRHTFRSGLVVARQQPVVLMLLLVEIFFGAYSEGFDRLWEAHLLTNFQFPTLGSLQPVIWFGIINFVSSIIYVIVAEIIVRRLNLTNHAQLAKVLLFTNTFVILGTIAFGLAGNFALAVVAFWLISIMRGIAAPLVHTWLNQSVDSQVRATVLSMVSQGNAFGQTVGGPVIGWIGTVRSLRTALVIGATLLSPVLPLYGRAIVRDKSSKNHHFFM